MEHAPHCLRRSSAASIPRRMRLESTSVLGKRTMSGTLALGLIACASYPERTAAALHDFQGGRFTKASAAYAEDLVTGSKFLSAAEAGTVALTAGDWDLALARFQEAAAAVEELEERALIGPKELGERLAAWALNDTQVAYQGEGFERVYVHSALAMAYLAKGELDSVHVEVRRANQLLEAEETLYEKSYAAGGLGHFLSALAYELRAELDQAYIDYERMMEKGVGTSLASQALVRIANSLRREEELDMLVQRYGPDEVRPMDAASIVLIAGLGLAPFKVEASLVVPTPDGVVPFAVPRFVDRGQTVSALRLVLADTGESVQTDLIEDVGEVAQANLSDRLAWMAAKSVARGILKRELTKSLEKKHGWGGRLAGDLFALFSERADLRSWQTLPDRWHAARFFVPPGEHALRLEALGGDAVSLGRYELKPGETMLVFARSLGPCLHAHAIGGRLVALVSPVAAAPQP